MEEQKWYNYKIDVCVEVIVGEDFDSEFFSKEFKDINDDRALAEAGEFMYEIMRSNSDYRVVLLTFIRKEGEENLIIGSHLLRLVMRVLNKYNEDLSMAASNTDAWKARAQQLKNDLVNAQQTKAIA
ncbi:hypothetical protein EPN15_03865 [Patescibacteria group bacterium]|nr:MAG: hypothetical protein EPN15_03865 [Patescibacteria group bacterium]